MLTVVYPGTFDPFTRGHEDLVRRAASLFGKVVVGVADSVAKNPYFATAERVAMAREVLAPFETSVVVFGVVSCTTRALARSCADCAPCPISSTSSRWPA
jgi:cytidyltransferase-like protein